MSKELPALYVDYKLSLYELKELCEKTDALYKDALDWIKNKEDDQDGFFVNIANLLSEAVGSSKLVVDILGIHFDCLDYDGKQEQIKQNIDNDKEYS